MLFTVIIGIISGVLYFNLMERDIPRFSNCSYIANIWTDIIALVYGLIITYYGYIYNSRILAIIGIGIITEHIMQFVVHKYETFTGENVNASNTSTKNKKIVDTLVRQSARYALAAEQDLSPLIAVLHANYAAGYLWALKDVVNENEINAIIGENKLKQLEEYIKKVQDDITRKASNMCPQYVGTPSNLEIAKLAGDL